VVAAATAVGTRRLDARRAAGHEGAAAAGEIVREYAHRLLNVFTVGGSRLSGNPLCVFEDGRGLDDPTMQALARQMNLSETTFILPSERATAAVRIFTPTFEMPFAGHPTLGTAHVVRALAGAGDLVRLETRAGVIPVRAEGDEWTLEANPPRYREVAATPAELAEMLGAAPGDVLEGARRVDTGSEQLVIPLRTPEAVSRCAPVAALLGRHGGTHDGRSLVYVFADAGAGEVRARFFFPAGTAIAEDPATGSGCANLGGWLLGRGAALPLARTIRQGDEVGRPSRLRLRVDGDRRIFVSGRVVELGRGVIAL
jgi:trans-2,3-dihydro-3-hydroxyanthranilate isomerase